MGIAIIGMPPIIGMGIMPAPGIIPGMPPIAGMGIGIMPAPGIIPGMPPAIIGIGTIIGTIPGMAPGWAGVIPPAIIGIADIGVIARSSVGPRERAHRGDTLGPARAATRPLGAARFSSARVDGPPLPRSEGAPRRAVEWY
jgi:hypothetical protein